MDPEPKPDTGSFDRAAKLGGAISRLKTERNALRAERDDLKAKLEKAPAADKLQADLDAARAELRGGKHKAAWKEAAAKAGLRPEAVDDAFGLSGYKAEADDVDPKAIEAAISKLKESRGYLFADESAPDPAAEKPPLSKGAGSERGKAPADPVKVRVRSADVRDPEFMKANQARMAEAARAGNLEVI